MSVVLHHVEPWHAMFSSDQFPGELKCNMNSGATECSRLPEVPMEYLCYAPSHTLQCATALNDVPLQAKCVSDPS